MQPFWFSDFNCLSPITRSINRLLNVCCCFFQVYRGIIAVKITYCNINIQQYNYGSGSVNGRGVNGLGGYGVVRLMLTEFNLPLLLLNAPDKNNIDRMDVDGCLE